MDSERTKYWTIEKAQGAVKASFFSRGLVLAEDDTEIWLRFTEIKRVITQTEGPIGDRTLSRALSGLVTSGGLKKKVEGKSSLYTLVIERPDRVKAFARAEAAAIEAAGGIGGMGDSTEGWAVYGVPDLIPKKFRVRFKRECSDHQDELREIVSDILDECVEAVLKPAKGRVSRKAFQEGKKAIDVLLELQFLGSLVIGYSVRLWGVVEGTVPGAQKAFQKGMGLNFAPETSLSERLSVSISALAKRPVEEVRPEVDKRMVRLEKKMQKAGLSLKVLWDALTPTEKARAERRLQATMLMTASLTSVVHA